MKKETRALDFSKFVFGVKAVICFGMVVKYNDHESLKGDIKMHFNRILNDCENFEKTMAKGLGKYADDEEELNGSIVKLVADIFDLPWDERDALIEHMNKFEYNESN
jgi:hypothetical protein